MFYLMCLNNARVHIFWAVVLEMLSLQTNRFTSFWFLSMIVAAEILASNNAIVQYIQ